MMLPENTKHQPSLTEWRKEWEKQLDDPNFEESFLEYYQERLAESEARPKDAALQKNWRTRQGWENANILSETKSDLKTIWIITVGTIAISTPMLIAFPDEWASGNHFLAIALIFPITAAYVLYLAITKTLEYRHFGKVPFQMDPYPGAIGGNIGGRLDIKNWGGVNSQIEATVRLECIYTYTTSGSDSRSRRVNIKWAQEGTPKIEHAGTDISLSFRFDIPDGLPPADADQSDAYHFWRLTVTVRRQGIDFYRRYNIPVFPTSEQSRYISHDISAQSVQRKEAQSEAIKNSIAIGDFDIPAFSHVMQVTDQHGELRFIFPMFRNKFLTLFSAAFAGGFGFFSYQLISDLLLAGLFGAFMSIFILPFSLIALVAAIAMIYLPLNNLRVTIKGTQIKVLRRLTFIPIYSRQFTRSDIGHLSIRKTGSTGVGVDKIKHFKLQANLNSGVKVTLAEDIDGEDAALHFKTFLARRLNVSEG